MPTPAESLLGVKNSQVDALEEQGRKLDERIASLTARNLALQDDAEARRVEMSTSYRARLAKRFADLDVSKALAGYPAYHDAKVLGGVYRLSPPKQISMIEVDKFAVKPEPPELGPVSATERLVLVWLTGVGNETEVRSLTDLPLSARLQSIRKLPEALLAKLADECGTIDTYLSIVLEMELGK